VLPGAAEKNSLRGVANGFASRATSPGYNRTVEAFAFPPIRVTPGRVHCELEPAGECLTELVASHEEPLAVCCACGVKFHLLGVRLGVAEPVLDDAPFLFGQEALRENLHFVR
jgi:hypothetical protein